MELRVNVGGVPREVLLTTLNKLSSVANYSADVSWLYSRIKAAVETQMPEPQAQGGPVTTGEPFAKEVGEAFIPYGENGPEPMVPRVAQPHAVRQNDLVAALRKVAQAFPPHTETHHVLSLLARELVDPKATSGYAYGRPVTPEQFEQAKDVVTPARPSLRTLCSHTILDPYRLCVLSKGHWGVGDEKGAHIDADGCVFQ